MSNSEKNTQLAKYLLYIVIGIVLLVPFHGFITTWVGSNTGGLLFWRAWKEFLLLLGGILAVILFARDKNLRKTICHSWFFRSMALFAVWQLVVALFLSRDADSTILGLAIQLRLFVVFLYAYIAVQYVSLREQQIQRLILIPALFVIIFGILQMFVLPHDFLSHFGYEKNITIPPFFTIDEQIDSIRITSTLRGPNPLGIYLILPLMVLINILHTVFTKISKSTRHKKEPKHSTFNNYIKIFSQNLLLHKQQMLLTTLSFIGAIIVLYGSHSRGAWIGFIVAIICYILLSVSGKWLTRILSIGILAIVVVVGLGYHYRQTSFVQNVILHDNPEEGGAVNSNQGHLEAINEGIEDVSERPLVGCGPGCAGPASVHNESGVSISENYFLQTAQESGVIGLLLLLGIFALIGITLFRMRPDPLSVVLLTSFIGITVANLFAHVWADDTIAYLWWGIAGLVIGAQKSSELTESSNH